MPQIQNNITTSFDSPEFARLIAAIDPINYADILTMPKLILSTGGDEFLLPDNNDYYWPALKGEKVSTCSNSCSGRGVGASVSACVWL